MNPDQNENRSLSILFVIKATNKNKQMGGADNKSHDWQAKN